MNTSQSNSDLLLLATRSSLLAPFHQSDLRLIDRSQPGTV
jgi:hypothetical protein